MSINEKGSATAPTVPSHGSTNPTKDQEMNSTKHSTRPAAAPAPTMDGVHAGVFELISLLEVIEDLSGEITFRKPDDKARQNIARVQNLANIAVHYAHHVEANLDDFISGANS